MYHVCGGRCGGDHCASAPCKVVLRENVWAMMEMLKLHARVLVFLVNGL